MITLQWRKQQDFFWRPVDHPILLPDLFVLNIYEKGPTTRECCVCHSNLSNQFFVTYHKDTTTATDYYCIKDSPFPLELRRAEVEELSPEVQTIPALFFLLHSQHAQLQIDAFLCGYDHRDGVFCVWDQRHNDVRTFHYISDMLFFIVRAGATISIGTHQEI